MMPVEVHREERIADLVPAAVRGVRGRTVELL